MTYQYLERILEKTWLRNNPDHPYNKWNMKPPDSVEKLFLSRFDNHLKKVASLLPTKKIQDKLRNYQNSQFVDTYYELEIGCFLIDNGFEVSFEPTLCDKTGNPRTPDIFIEKEETIVEVKTLHESDKVKKGKESGKVFEFNTSIRIKDIISNELYKWRKGIKYPLIIVICPDEIEEPLVTSDDFEAELYRQSNRVVFSHGKVYWTSDVEYSGRYFLDEGRNALGLSGVGLWRRRGRRREIVFYENRNVNKDSKIPHGRFLDFLKRD